MQATSATITKQQRNSEAWNDLSRCLGQSCSCWLTSFDIWLVGSCLPAQVVQQIDGGPLFLLRCASRNASLQTNYAERFITVVQVRKSRGPAGIHILVDQKNSPFSRQARQPKMQDTSCYQSNAQKPRLPRLGCGPRVLQFVAHQF